MDDFRLRAGTTIGDYRLDEFLAESPTSLTWRAEQQSIRRQVVVIELKPTALHSRDAFLANVRAQAAVDHPLIGSVYEAINQPDYCFAALERLPGSSLAERLASRQAMKPVQVAHILRRVSEASLTLESAGTPTGPMRASDVFLDSHGVVRLANLARAGEREPGRSEGDITTLGRELVPLVADGHPGASRMQTLLAWMRGEGLDRSLTWAEIRSYAEQIEQQLAEAPAAAAPPTSRVQAKKSPLPLILGAAAVGIVAIVGVFALKGGGDGKTAKPLPSPVVIPEGSHPLPDGGESALPAFELGAHEVTIGEYESFLKALAALPPERQKNYDPEGQPPGKTGHEPDGWADMLAAIKSGGQWQGRTITRDCPVVNVDWWDATAYCNWKLVHLPTEEQWWAAMRHQLPEPSSLRPAGWGGIHEIPPTDRTPAGLLGMAGSVSEWTRSQSLNPANPLGEKNWVLMGGSFLKPSSGATAREWTTDRSLKRPDLGFRVVE
ncbi:SUMF1/EgtB/PvdO family nonheme iron enzyme [Luteolibacter flavescens]|uniref:SUMF1/EgtB/PvdO family nonheme iron enzyme n=1 Tax=Luteolibacter flavescens TaxID=1859460 RepID=A0ABT3FNR0_9BACT|nr:SUMF1/EgtB/PvdO family nonheme iron enzyme [Luteolibacter flavescens]MCW1885211.1 SUMF1/EgtB/PvdO family nonheme iron enzyme [Luteolibacter flavescens]